MWKPKPAALVGTASNGMGVQKVLTHVLLLWGSLEKHCQWKWCVISGDALALRHYKREYAHPWRSVKGVSLRFIRCALRSPWKGKGMDRWMERDGGMDGWMDGQGMQPNLHFLEKTVWTHHLLYSPDQSCCVLGTVRAMGGPQAIVLHKCMWIHECLPQGRICSWVWLPVFSQAFQNDTILRFPFSNIACGL